VAASMLFGSWLSNNYITAMKKPRPKETGAKSLVDVQYDPIQAECSAGVNRAALFSGLL
jgi:hypothetical protein